MSDTKKDNPEPNGSEKKKMRLDLNPKIEVETTIGPLFLYEAGSKAIAEYAKQPPGEPSPKVRRYLGQIASKTHRPNLKDKHEPLHDEAVEALTEDDLERMAQAYLQTWNNQHYIAKASKEEPATVRGDSESATSFLDRIIVYRANHQNDIAKELAAALSDNSGINKIADAMRNATSFNKISEALNNNLAITKAQEHLKDILAFNKIPLELTTSEIVRKLAEEYGSSSKALADLHKQADGLSSMANDFRQRQSGLDELRRSIAEQRTLDIGPSPLIDIVRKNEDLRRQEHAEEIDLTRQIGEMSARSAELLARVSNTATTFLGQFTDFFSKFTESAKRADAGAQRNLRIAICALVASVLLSGFSAWYALKSFTQDTENNLSGDKWQQELLLAIKKQTDVADNSNRVLSTANEQLRHRVDELERRVASKALKK